MAATWGFAATDRSAVTWTGAPDPESTFTLANGKYEASTFVCNIADRVQVTHAIDFNNLLGLINEPRTFGVAFKARF